MLLDNARRIVTTWTNPEHAPLEDYSARLWSGLVGNYYRGRWQIWLDGLRAAATSTDAPDATALQHRLIEHTRDFLASGASPAAPSSDTASQARRLHNRYAGLLTAAANSAGHSR